MVDHFKHFDTRKPELSIKSTILKASKQLMGLYGSRAFILVFLVVLDGIRERFVGGDVSAKNYITWDDMKVDEHKAGLNIRDTGDEQSQVIVVDRNGGGDSRTVQGAVDMVPEHNTQRVKINILPGLYR